MTNSHTESNNFFEHQQLQSIAQQGLQNLSQDHFDNFNDAHNSFIFENFYTNDNGVLQNTQVNTNLQPTRFINYSINVQTPPVSLNYVQPPDQEAMKPTVHNPTIITNPSNSQSLPPLSPTKRPPPAVQSNQVSQPEPKRQKTIDNISLSEKNQRLFEQQPLHIQVKYRVAAFFQAYSSSVSELIKKFVGLVLSIDIDQSGSTDTPEAFAVAFEIANDKAPQYFWIGLRLQALLLARIRNWLTAMIKNKKYDGTQPCLQGLSSMSLTEEHLERYKLNKVLALLIKRGDVKTQEICNHILNRATQLTRLNSAAKPAPVRPKAISSSTKAIPVKVVSSKSQREQNLKALPAATFEKPVKASSPSIKLVKVVKPTAPVSTVKKPASAGNSFFKSLQTPKPTTVSSNSSIPIKGENKQVSDSKPVATSNIAVPSKSVAPVLSFSSHLKSIREAKKKDIERKVKPVEPVAKKSKKSVRWRDDDLTETREYYLDPEERAEKQINIQSNAKGMEYREAITAFSRTNTEPEQEEELEWYSPKSIDLSMSSIPPQMLEQYPPKRCGSKKTESKEAEIQKNREAHTLIAMYMDASEIPDSPAEPDEPETNDGVQFKEIPLANSWKKNPSFMKFFMTNDKDSFRYQQQVNPEAGQVLSKNLTAWLSELSQKSAFNNDSGNNFTNNSNYNNSDNTYNNFMQQPQNGAPSSQPTITPELLSQLKDLTNVLNLSVNGLSSNGTNNYNNNSNNHYNSNYTNNSYGNNNNHTFNDETQQYQKKRPLTPKMLALRQQDVRESVRNDTTTLDKWKYPCMFYSKYCSNGDGCHFLHLVNDKPT